MIILIIENIIKVAVYSNFSVNPLVLRLVHFSLKKRFGTNFHLIIFPEVF